MIKYCYDRWKDKEKDLKQVLEENKDLDSCTYLDLVKIVTKVILGEEQWNINKIHEIDDGDYQGTLIFLIPSTGYQPTNNEYLITYIGYGSCSVCDTLMSIQNSYPNEVQKEEKIKEYMHLCRDIIMNMIHPYPGGYILDSSSLDIVVEVDN